MSMCLSVYARLYIIQEEKKKEEERIEYLFRTNVNRELYVYLFVLSFNFTLLVQKLEKS